MKVLVTGATGFLGSEIARELVRQGHSVRALVRPTSRRDALAGLPIDAMVGDIRDPGSVGRAVRYPTVGELYGATTGGALSFINDPFLKPEKSWTSELSAEKDLGNGLARATLFLSQGNVGTARMFLELAVEKGSAPTTLHSLRRTIHRCSRRGEHLAPNVIR